MEWYKISHEIPMAQAELNDLWIKTNKKSQTREWTMQNAKKYDVNAKK